MKKTVLLLGLCGVSFAVPLVELDLSVGALQQKPSGSIRYRGDQIDLKNTFGLGDETKPFARLKFEHPVPLIPNLHARYIPSKFEGSRNVNFRFADTQFTGNIQSSVKLDKYDLGLHYNVPFVGIATMGMIDPEVGITVRYIDFEASVTGNSGGQIVRRSKSASLAVPMAYAGLSINLPVKLSLVGELRYLGYSGNTYYDWNGEVRFRPVGVPLIGSFYIGVGYREEKLKLDNVSDIYSDIKVKGMYGVLGVNF